MTRHAPFAVLPGVNAELHIFVRRTADTLYQVFRVLPGMGKVLIGEVTDGPSGWTWESSQATNLDPREPLSGSAPTMAAGVCEVIRLWMERHTK